MSFDNNRERGHVEIAVFGYYLWAFGIALLTFMTRLDWRTVVVMAIVGATMLLWGASL